MAVSLTLPRLGAERKSSTRDLIVNVLSEEWPLSTKEIFNRLKKDSAFTGSYQSVHKVLLQMLEKGMLERKEKRFQFSRDWINRIKRFGTEFDLAYSNKQGAAFKDLHRKDNFALSFVNSLDLGKFLGKAFFHYPNPEKKPGVILTCNSYPTIGLSIDEMTSIIAGFRAVPWFVLIGGNTLVDKLFSKPFTLIGVKFKFGVHHVGPHDIFVQSDYVCNIHWPQKLLKEWQKEITRTKGIKDFNLKRWFDLMYGDFGEVWIVVNKNEEVADRIRSQVLQHFQGASK